jgi:hypothetical protein
MRLAAIALLVAGCGDGAPAVVDAASAADAPGPPDAAPAVDAAVPPAPIVVVGEPPLPNWDGIYPWSIAVVDGWIYWSDRVLGAGYVWRVPEAGGAPETAFPLSGVEAGMEYCLGGGGGENAGWIVARPGHVHWVGCMGRVRDADVASGTVARIGTWDADHLVATATHLYGTRGAAGEVGAFELATGTATVVATPLGSPAYLAADELYLYVSDVEGAVLRAPIAGGAAESLATSTWPHGIAADATHVYWADPAEGAIRRIAKGGGAVELVADGQTSPVGIAIDDLFVYFTSHPDLGPGAVLRVAKGGGDPELLATGNLDAADEAWGPWQVVVTADSVYWTETYGRGAIMKLAKP